MITPSDLPQRIIQDPGVDDKIKKLLQDAITDNNQDTLRSALHLATLLYPQYEDEINMTSPDLMMPDYQQKFNKETMYGRSRYKEGADKAIADLLQPYRS